MNVYYVLNIVWLQPSIGLLEERPSKAFITTGCINVYVVIILFVYFGDSIPPPPSSGCP